MLSAEDNALLTGTNPGTAMGRVLRNYWQPLLLTAELPDERPVKDVRIMGEDLVVFRDEAGRYGALKRRCAHRSGDLCYGRLEDGGLRCPFHGWLYDVEGRCLEQPAEPAGSRFHEKIRQPAYPCLERNGIVHVYMGGGEPPLLPGFDWHLAPESHVFAFKGYQRANWLQALEGEIDPAHLSYLHRYLVDEIDAERSYGLDQFLGTAEDTDLPLTEILRNSRNPRLEIEEADFGLRIFALREAGANTHVRVTNFVFPNIALVALGDWGVIQQHVPIDDGSNWRFDIYFAYGAAIDKDTLLREKLNTYSLPDYMPKRNFTNRYQFSAEEQKTRTYAGIGYDFNVHDTMIVEGAGPIQDRTTEHLGYGDKAIIAARHMLLAAARSGDPAMLPIATRDPARNIFDHLATVDTVTPPDRWRTGWVPRHKSTRAASSWAGRLGTEKLDALTDTPAEPVPAA